MRLFLLFSLLLTGLIGRGQDRWQVMLNGKTIFTSHTEDPEKNIIVIKGRLLKKRNFFSVKFTDAEKKKGWQRFIAAVTDQGHEAIRQKGNSFRIKNDSLLALFKKSGNVKIYTWVLPTDPAMQAAVRVRRIHLCTLKPEN